MSRPGHDDLSPEALWHRRVDRGLGETTSPESVAAGHGFLEAIDADDPAAWFDGKPTEAQQEAQRKYLDELGRISGAGPYPG
jgi:hypothetical protein